MSILQSQYNHSKLLEILAENSITLSKFRWNEGYSNPTKVVYFTMYTGHSGVYYRNDRTPYTSFSLYNAGTNYNLTYKGFGLTGYLEKLIEDITDPEEATKKMAEALIKILNEKSKEFSNRNKKRKIQEELNLLDDDLSIELDEWISENIKTNPNVTVKEERTDHYAFYYTITSKENENSYNPDWFIHIYKNNKGTWGFSSSIYVWQIVHSYKPKENKDYISLLKLHYNWLKDMPSRTTLTQFK